MRFAYVRFFSFFKRKCLRTARGYTKNASSKHSKPANGGFYTPSAACCPTSRSRPVVGATLSGSSVQRLKLDPNLPVSNVRFLAIQLSIRFRQPVLVSSVSIFLGGLI